MPYTYQPKLAYFILGDLYTYTRDTRALTEEVRTTVLILCNRKGGSDKFASNNQWGWKLDNYISCTLMERKHLKEFVLTQNIIRQAKGYLSPRDLYVELCNWGKQLRESKDARIRDLYMTYLFYFEKLNVDDYMLEPMWYDLNALIEFDLLRPTPSKLERAVIIVRDALWELIAFKTDRGCKVLPIDNLRLLTDGQKKGIFFFCDTCFYAENIDGKRIKVDYISYPATKDQILKNDIHPGKP